MKMMTLRLIVYCFLWDVLFVILAFVVSVARTPCFEDCGDAHVAAQICRTCAGLRCAPLTTDLPNS